MAAPTWNAIGTLLNGTFTNTVAIPVPAGLVLNSVILVGIYCETGDTISGPAGFTQAPNSPAAMAGQNLLSVWWKRQTSATGAGETTGTYAFTKSTTTSAWWTAVAARFQGCITTGNPIDVSNSATKTTSTTATTPAVSVTTTGADELLVFWATAYPGGGTWTQSSGFTERQEQESLTLADKTQAAAGASGSVVATYSANEAETAWLGALLPVATANTSNFFALF
jgi:hypothetical protein